MEIDQKQIEQIFQSAIGAVAGLFLLACAIFLFRQVIENFVAGWIFKRSTELAYDQPLLISGRPARVVRIGVLYSVFYLADKGTRMVIPNRKLGDLTIEIDLEKYKEKK